MTLVQGTDEDESAPRVEVCGYLVKTLQGKWVWEPCCLPEGHEGKHMTESEVEG